MLCFPFVSPPHMWGWIHKQAANDFIELTSCLCNVCGKEGCSDSLVDMGFLSLGGNLGGGKSQPAESVFAGTFGQMVTAFEPQSGVLSLGCFFYHAQLLFSVNHPMPLSLTGPR